MACMHSVDKLAKLGATFVVEKKGTWGHGDWEQFCAMAQETGFELNEYNRVALGNLLESLRYFYQLSPASAAPAKKKADPCKPAVKKSAAKKPAAKKAASK